MINRLQYIITAAAVLAALSVVAGCGAGATVRIDQTLEPQTITIQAGETVTWKSEDRRNHQIMSGAPPVMTEDFISPVLQRGDDWSHPFDEPGEYPYHDMRTGLVGVVVVTER